MSTTYARSELNGENLHRRDGSLLRRKREQWAKERAEVDSWFPFGSPGGGAPNKKYEPVSPVQLDKSENRPSSCRSNGDSGRWSDSENIGPNKEVSEHDTHRSEFTYPYIAASTSSAASTVYIPTTAQLPDGTNFNGLPHIAAPPAAFMTSSNAPIPVQLVCPPIPYGRAMPVSVELSQTQSSSFPVMYPLRLVPSAPVACSTSQGGLEEQRADLPSINSSYTEQWANQLSYWGNTGSCKDDPLSPKEITQIALPSIPAAQPLAVVKPMVIPLVTSSHTEKTYPLANPSGSDDIAHGSMSESSTSLNSSCRRGGSYENKGNASISEQVINEQIAEKQRAEARRLEEERREAVKKENERRRMEEIEKNREVELERRKKEAEEEQKRREDAVLAAIEEAKREAEKFRKAKLYKHVLEDSENSAELEHSILGYDDASNVKILKEVKSLERQKKYELKTLEKNWKTVTTKKDEQRRMSLDDGRPIRPPSRLNNTHSSCTSNEEPARISRKGRQSLRLPPTKKPVYKHRNSSLEQKDSESPKETTTVKSSVRRPVLSCTIPVRPQRRIPPPSARNHYATVNDDVKSEANPENEVITDVISLEDESLPSKFSDKHIDENKEIKKGNSIELCYEFLFPVTSADNHSISDVPALVPISVTPFRSLPPRRSSHDALSFLSGIPNSEGKKTSQKRRSNQVNGNSLLQNPLFQPVATRSRRSKASMENAGGLDASSSTSSDSPGLVSNEENSSLPNGNFSNESRKDNFGVSKMESEHFVSDTAGSPASCKVMMNEVDANCSPFRRKLANTNVLSRHREEELLSPEIKRRGECPVSSSLRSSLANLSVDGSEDGRISPVSPLLQRFNSKTSQYRSLNLKKTSERNQKILERLAEIRSRLPQHHSADRDVCKNTYLNKSPHQTAFTEGPRKSSESVTAV